MGPENSKPPAFSRGCFSNLALITAGGLLGGVLGFAYTSVGVEDPGLMRYVVDVVLGVTVGELIAVGALMFASRRTENP